MFFVISGFLITYLLLKEEQQTGFGNHSFMAVSFGLILMIFPSVIHFCYGLQNLGFVILLVHSVLFPQLRIFTLVKPQAAHEGGYYQRISNDGNGLMGLGVLAERYHFPDETQEIEQGFCSS